MKLKSTIITIICILIVAVVTVTVYCLWPAINGTVTDNKYYSAEEVETIRENAYADGCKTKDELTGQVKYYKDLVDEMKVDAELGKQVPGLTARIEELERIVEDTENMLTLLGIENTYVASFYVKDQLYHSMVVNAPATVSVEVPTLEEGEFLGWAVDGEIVDLSTYQISKHTHFHAVIRYLVTFKYHDTVLRTMYKNYGDTFDLNQEIELDGKTYYAWSIDGTNCLYDDDTTNGRIPYYYTVTSNVTFYALTAGTNLGNTDDDDFFIPYDPSKS